MSERIFSVNPQVIKDSIGAIPPALENLWHLYNVSFQRTPTGNLLVVSSDRQNPTDIDFYLDLAQIAKFVHSCFGSTQICVYRSDDDALMSWSSEEVIELATSWDI